MNGITPVQQQQVEALAGSLVAKLETFHESLTPDEQQVLAMFAVGRPGRIEDLPEKLRARETPSGRMPLEDFLREGAFRPQPKPQAK